MTSEHTPTNVDLGFVSIKPLPRNVDANSALFIATLTHKQKSMKETYLLVQHGSPYYPKFCPSPLRRHHYSRSASRIPTIDAMMTCRCYKASNSL